MDSARTSGLMRDVAPQRRETPAPPATVAAAGTAAPTLGDRFAAKLADLKGKAAPSKDKGGTKAAREAPPHGGVAKLPGREQRRWTSDERAAEGDHANGASATMAAPLPPASAVRAQEVTPVAPPAIDQAIERMAAAIAEARDAGAGNVMRIDFPHELAQGLATGAVVARDAATGALSIRVIASGVLLSDGRRSNLEDELRRNLERRRLRVASVAIEGSREGLV